MRADQGQIKQNKTSIKHFFCGKEGDMILLLSQYENLFSAEQPLLKGKERI